MVEYPQTVGQSPLGLLKTIYHNDTSCLWYTRRPSGKALWVCSRLYTTTALRACDRITAIQESGF
ncbi:MAG: hypothetical protein LBS90_03005, partial [Oscillospiraceae bacterium]|nr:hypothetical protein [Oscillospiraceae bacterium]